MAQLISEFKANFRLTPSRAFPFFGSPVVSVSKNKYMLLLLVNPTHTSHHTPPYIRREALGIRLENSLCRDVDVDLKYMKLPNQLSLDPCSAEC